MEWKPSDIPSIALVAAGAGMLGSCICGVVGISRWFSLTLAVAVFIYFYNRLKGK